MYVVTKDGTFDYDGNELTIDDIVRLHEAEGHIVTRSKELRTIYRFIDRDTYTTSEEMCNVLSIKT